MSHSTFGNPIYRKLILLFWSNILIQYPAAGIKWHLASCFSPYILNNYEKFSFSECFFFYKQPETDTVDLQRPRPVDTWKTHRWLFGFENTRRISFYQAKCYLLDLTNVKADAQLETYAYVIPTDAPGRFAMKNKAFLSFSSRSSISSK